MGGWNCTSKDKQEWMGDFYARSFHGIGSGLRWPFTDGSIPFISNSILAEDSSNLFWNVGMKQLESYLIRITSAGSAAYPALKLNDRNTGIYSGGSNKISFSTDGIHRMTVDATGQVGIGTATPTTQFSVKEKAGISPIGGICIKLTNKTGVDSVAGKLVQADTSANDAVKLTDIDEEETFGVFLESGIAANAEAWVVISGIADVAMEDNTTATRGNWVRSSITEAGYADATNATPPSPAAFSHFNEIGNCIETVTATGIGTHILARCVLHFNQYSSIYIYL